MNKVLGGNLKKVREANRFTQDQLAEFLRINRSTYSNYETGEREIPLELLEKTANLFGVDMYLFYEDDQAIVENMLACSFRVDNLNSADMEEIAQFKNIVKNYIKINNLLTE